jgi:hypothetical protein
MATNSLEILFTGAAFGVLFHISTLPVDLDFKIWLLLKSYAAAFCGVFIVLITTFHFGPISSLAMTLYIAASFHVGLFSSMVIYRLFFHRLRKFPGPFGAKITRFYPVYLSAKKQQYILDLQGFHRKYGDVVRTGKILSPSHVDDRFSDIS